MMGGSEDRIRDAAGAAGWLLIVAAGEITDYARHRALLGGLPRPDAVLCADGGLRHLDGLGVVPDVVLGDFDSADASLAARYGARTERYPAAKDYTDTELAVERAAADGGRAILILGALGARLDHTVTNLLISFKYARLGVRVVLADAYGLSCAFVGGGTIRINAREPLACLLGLTCGAGLAGGTGAAHTPPQGYKLSILPAGGGARGVRTHGLLYELKDADLEAHYTTGLSNEFTADEAAVEFSEGALYIMLCAD